MNRNFFFAPLWNNKHLLQTNEDYMPPSKHSRINRLKKNNHSPEQKIHPAIRASAPNQ
jgi:hypothetical protein